MICLQPSLCTCPILFITNKISVFVFYACSSHCFQMELCWKEVMSGIALHQSHFDNIWKQNLMICLCCYRNTTVSQIWWNHTSTILINQIMFSLVFVLDNIHTSVIFKTLLVVYSLTVFTYIQFYRELLLTRSSDDCCFCVIYFCMNMYKSAGSECLHRWQITVHYIVLFYMFPITGTDKNWDRHKLYLILELQFHSNTV